MKTTILIEKKVNITRLHLIVAVRYDEDDMPNDYPFRTRDQWSVVIDIDNGQIESWPKGVKPLEFYMKVTDQGTYTLIDDDGNQVSRIQDNYVPNNLVPGEYGDYIEFKINKDGLITNWPKQPNFDDFF